MPLVQKRDWPVCLCLAATLGPAASSHAFADPDRAHLMKPVITGFIDMQTITWHNKDDGKPNFTLRNVSKYPGMFGGIVVNATWDEMQHQPDALNTTRIENALQQVREYNAAHPTAPLGVKLRIFSGNQAPLWAKQINGGPLTIQRNFPGGCPVQNTCPITIGKVWDSQYIAAWREFQQKVAALYDSEPLIRSVAITSCTMQTDEPFVLPMKQKPPSGYTNVLGQDCLSGAVDDYSAWRRTAIDYTFNAFPLIQPRGPPDSTFSISVMDTCRAKLKKRCELGNHALAANMVNPNLGIVQAIATRGGPIHYQTEGPKNPAFVNWIATVHAARQFNATALELWPDKKFGGFMTLSQPAMRNLYILFNGGLPPSISTGSAEQ
jgi:hypothetical protein